MLDGWVAARLGLPAPLTRRALERRQLERICDTLAHAAAHSAFYRARLPADRVSSWEEFAALPFTWPEDIRTQGARMVCVGGGEIERVFTVLETSGSSGRPKRICFTAGELEDTVDYFHHGMLEFAGAGDTAAILFPGRSPHSLNALLSEALRRMGAVPVVLGLPGPEDGPAVLERIVSLGARRLIGPPFAVAALAERSRALGLDGPVGRTVDSVLLAGSFVSETHCRTISEIWGCRIDEEYGMTETGLAGAVGCTLGGGYHPWSSDLYYEIVDPETGAVLPDGQEGELTVTTLGRRGMPLIRYRTGDISRILPGPCPCGSVLPHMARVGDRHCEKKYQRVSPDDITGF